MSVPDVSVIVPSWGAPATVPALLAALRNQTLTADRFEVLVVDAGADGGMRRLQDLAHGWDGAELKLLRGPLPGGPGARRNRGAREARGSLLAFTDTDCEPEPGWLEAGLAAQVGGAQVIQGVTLPPDGARILPFDHHQALTRETALYETCNIFYERRLFERIGGFTSRYFRRFLTPFGEDAELGWRTRRAGARFCFEPNAVVRHTVMPRSPGAHARYQWQARAFPLLVRDVPELRDARLYRRWFLSRRSAGFAAAAMGAGVARRMPSAALLALPYLRRLGSETRLHQGGVSAQARYASMRFTSDALLFAALLCGSGRWRRLVL